MIGLVYLAYPGGCRHKFTFLPRLRPYPIKSHSFLQAEGNVCCVQAKLTSEGWSTETVTALRYLLASEEESRAAKSLQPKRWVTEVVQYRQLPTFGYVFKEMQSDATETRVDQVPCGALRSELVLLVA